MNDKKSIKPQSSENTDDLNDKRFKWFFENSPVGESITNINGGLFVNKAFANIVGYSVEELRSKHWNEITHPDDIELNDNEINLLLNGEKESTNFTKRFIKKDGKIVWVEVRTSLQFDENNNPKCFNTSIIDITEKKQESINRDFHHKILEILSDVDDENDIVKKILDFVKQEIKIDAIALRYSDSDKKFTFKYSNGFSDIFLNNECFVESKSNGIDKKYKCLCGLILNENNNKFLTENKSFFTNNLQKFVSENSNISHENIKNICLQEGFQSVALIPLLNKEKEKIGVVQLNHSTVDFFNSDLIKTLENIAKSLSIALQKQELINNIKESKKQFQNIVDNIDEVFFIIGKDLKINFLSPSVERISGFSVDEIIKNVLINFFHPDDRERFCKNFQQVIDGKSLENEYQLLKKDGSFFWVRTITKPLVEGNEIIGIIGTFSVIEDKKNKENEIIRLNKELEQIIYVTSHDLRTPLVNINGFSQEIKKTLSLLNDTINHENDVQSIKDAFAKNYKLLNEYLQFIFPSVTKINNLIDSLLAISRIGKVEPTISTIDMNKLANEILMIMEFKLKTNNVNIYKTELPSCIGDVNLLNQLFLNLIDNSVKYRTLKGNANINIYCIENHRTNSYYIQDNGIGMKKEDLEKIFNLFYRANKTVQGEGIGLSIVKKIIEKLNGEIKVESELNKGTTFIVTLPK